MSQKGSQKWRHYRPLISSLFPKQKPSVNTLNLLFSQELIKGNNPLKEANKFENSFNGLIEMEKNDKFRIDKWKTFVKLWLLTEDNIKSMLKPHVKQEDLFYYSASSYIYERVEFIKKELLKSEDFRMTFLQYSKDFIPSIIDEIREYNQQVIEKHPDKEIPIDENKLNILLQNIYSETLKPQLLDASAYLTLNLEQASFLNKKEIEDLKIIGNALEAKLKTIDFSKNGDPEKWISVVKDYLEKANNFTSKLSILNKVKTFLTAVSSGESISKAFIIAFKNPSILNKLVNSITVNLEKLDENPKKHTPS